MSLGGNQTASFNFEVGRENSFDQVWLAQKKVLRHNGVKKAITGLC